MPERACVFHHPFPVDPDGISGSNVRPYRMMRAFEALGYEVLSVTGYARERRARASEVIAKLQNGRRIDFVYSESHTLPAALTEPHHLPTSARLDVAFLATMKRARVPVGLFYRDVLWRFDGFAQHYPPLKRLFATFFYKQEWRDITRVADHLFLPSLEMLDALPTSWPAAKVSALPPGTNPATDGRGRMNSLSESLELLYVGGITPPYYDLTPLFTAANRDDRLRLTVCCRPKEWEAVSGHYPSSDTIEVVHASGAALEPYYERAAAVAILREPHPYLEFAMPVKVFEALAHGLPVITSDSGAVATFVRRYDVGWVVESFDVFHDLVTRLLSDRSLLERAYARVAGEVGHHTWEERARQVARTLAGERSSPSLSPGKGGLLEK